MAPEQLQKQLYSRASDVFAFGVVIYETMSGREPWEGLLNTAACHKVLNGERLPVPARAPAPLGELMRLCFETEPDMRPTMDDACRRLDRIVATAEETESGRSNTNASSTLRTPQGTRTLAVTDYDEPDTGSTSGQKYDEPAAGARPLALSEAYSLAPDPREVEHAYSKAPSISEASIRRASQRDIAASAAGNNTLQSDSAYDEPSAPTLNPAVAKMSDKEQARLWRLSKKYEPKSEPPLSASSNAAATAAPAAEPAVATMTANGSIRVPVTGLSDDQGPLPEGWRCAISPKSGRIYYYQKGSKTTQWVRPE
jgi:serine/threonine protein kinase